MVHFGVCPRHHPPTRFSFPHSMTPVMQPLLANSITELDQRAPLAISRIYSITNNKDAQDVVKKGFVAHTSITV